MNREQLCKEARDLMTRKNHDYAGSEGDSPWMNFQRSEIMGLCKTEQAFMVRILDKISRMITFINNGELMVKEEGVEDSIIDIVNYMVLFSAFLKDKKTEEASKNFTGGVHNGDQPCYNAVGDERFDKEEVPEPFAEMT